MNFKVTVFLAQLYLNVAKSESNYVARWQRVVFVAKLSSYLQSWLSIVHDNRLLEPVEVSAMENLMQLFSSIGPEMSRYDLQSGF